MKIVIFDVDGTLMDSSAYIVERMRRTFARFDLPFPGRDAALSIVGLSLKEAFAKLLGPACPAAEMAAYYRTLSADLREDPAFRERLFPGVDAALRTLAAREGMKIGVATGKSRRGVAEMIERHGWRGLFSAIQTADDAPSKPHPAMLLQAIAEAGGEPDHSVMVGDSSYDIEMAGAAKVRSIAVDWGFQSIDRLMALGATASISHFDELPGMVDRLLTREAQGFPSASA